MSNCLGVTLFSFAKFLIILRYSSQFFIVIALLILYPKKFNDSMHLMSITEYWLGKMMVNIAEAVGIPTPLSLVNINILSVSLLSANACFVIFSTILLF